MPKKGYIFFYKLFLLIYRTVDDSYVHIDVG
jgi:hypothetical protein